MKFKKADDYVYMRVCVGDVREKRFIFHRIRLRKRSCKCKLMSSVPVTRYSSGRFEHLKLMDIQDSLEHLRSLWLSNLYIYYYCYY